PIPGSNAGYRLLQEQLLDVVGELMRLLLSDVLEPWAVVAKRARRHGALEQSVIDPVELEFEEQKVAGERRHPLVGVTVELRPRGVAGVGGVEQRSVGH